MQNMWVKGYKNCHPCLIWIPITKCKMEFWIMLFFPRDLWGPLLILLFKMVKWCTEPNLYAVRYRQSPDPTVEEVRRLATGLRRSARDERVLFHYNGHGVPKPTANGEIWVFNRSYTQYIPLSIYNLQTWMGSPSIYVWDCNNAGRVKHRILGMERLAATY